jgi:hypothetical protein
MIPGPWEAAVLALGVYRIVRLIGWDDLPPIERVRIWLVGAELVRRGTQASLAGLTSEDPELVWVFRRPMLNHFIHCAFCQGFWVSVCTYVAWIEEPYWTLTVLAAFALSGAVGLIAKNLDA